MLAFPKNYIIILNVMSNTNDKKPTNMRRTLHYYWEITKKYAGYNLFVLISSIVVIFVRNVLLAFIMSDVINDLQTGGDHNELAGKVIFKGILIIVLHILSQALNQARMIANWKSEILAMYDLYNKAFDTVCYQSMQFHVDRFSGSLVTQTNRFVRAYERFMDVIVWSILPFVVSLVSVLVIISLKLPLFALFILLFTAIYLIISIATAKKFNKHNEDIAAAESKATGQLADAISNITSVKSYAREKYEKNRYDRFAKAQRDVTEKFMYANLKRNIKYDIVYVLFNSIRVGVLIIGGLYWNIPFGLIFLVVTYTGDIMNSLWDINHILKDLNRVFGDAKEMTEILDLVDDVVDLEDAKPLAIDKAEIDFNNIAFKHKDAKEFIFNDFNLKVKPGERIGLVGISGSGKTPLTKLLLRFADVNEGVITIDGQDIKHATQESLRKAIAYVPQETALFHRSIAENIAYARPTATKDEIERAAKLANAHEFIKDLPNGYETLVGERGIKLSGGQRQRIAIARAILKDAPILVLDEATSALDSESEALIQEALGKLMKGRTSIVIAHRLSTIASLDRIVVLKDGEIVEQGSHKQLLKNGGDYAKLWSRQSGAFMDED